MSRPRRAFRFSPPKAAAGVKPYDPKRLSDHVLLRFQPTHVAKVPKASELGGADQGTRAVVGRSEDRPSRQPVRERWRWRRHHLDVLWHRRPRFRGRRLRRRLRIVTHQAGDEARSLPLTGRDIHAAAVAHALLRQSRSLVKVSTVDMDERSETGGFTWSIGPATGDTESVPVKDNDGAWVVLDDTDLVWCRRFTRAQRGGGDRRGFLTDQRERRRLVGGAPRPHHLD